MAPSGPAASRIISAGIPLITGGVVSWTVMVKLAWAVLPAESVAEQVMGVTPMEKVFPEAEIQVTGTGPLTTSEAVGDE
jgi:hypothetical protein